MKRVLYYIALIALPLAMAGCSSDNNEEETWNDENTEYGTESSSLDDNNVVVTWNGTSATVSIASNISQLVTATIKGGHVCLLADPSLAEEVTYTLSGSSSNGSLYMNGSYKATFVFNGLSLTSARTDSAAINIRDGKRIALVLADGTTNSLTDKAGGTHKACMMVKGHAEFQGAGTLNLTGNTGHAFWSKEYTELKASTGTITVKGAEKDGFNVNQYFQMNGGTVNVSSVGDDGIQVSYETDDDGNIEADEENTGEVLIKGGTLTIATTAAGSKGLKAEGAITVNEDKGTTIVSITNSGGVDTSDSSNLTASCCMKSDEAITIAAGTVTLANNGQGGRAMRSEGTINVTGGTVNATVKGSNYGSSSSGMGGGKPGGGWGSSSSSSNHKYAKCIKATGNLTISDGSVTAYSANHEGIESKAQISIEGGTVYVVAGDDAINSDGDLYIKGGNTYAYSGNDGLDANGNMYIQGGVAVAFGASGAESGIDIDERHKLYITGGEIFGIGGRVDASIGSASQAYGTNVTAPSCSSGSYYVLSQGDTRLFAVKVPAAYSGTVLISSSAMSSGTTYTLGTASSVSGTEVNGFIASPTVGSVSNARSFTARK